MEKLGGRLNVINDFVWGPAMLLLFMGTGIILTIRTRGLCWRNIGYAIKNTVSKTSRAEDKGKGDVSPFSALTTSLAASIGTGNIVGVATAMVAGGPGALVWMWISAALGMTTMFGECMLAIKYREINEKGEMCGGPMYTMKNGLRNKKLGVVAGWIFSLFAVVASFGIGNMTQANSISESLNITFGISEPLAGVVITVVALIVIVGGIKSIAKVSQVMVPFMAIFYVTAGLIVIAINFENVPAGLAMIFKMAFSVEAVGGGLSGAIVVSMTEAIRFGISRGVFSNEAGMGASAISASAARTDNHVRQGYISMTGVFYDTIVVCSITGLCIASSGVLGSMDAKGELLSGAALTIAAFSSALGETGAYLVCIGIAMFAFATILGWEYHGEKAFEYLLGTHRYNMLYKILFSAVVYVGATTTLEIAWSFSDIANALMAVPNLICLLVMSGEIARDVISFQKEIGGR